MSHTLTREQVDAIRTRQEQLYGVNGARNPLAKAKLDQAFLVNLLATNDKAICRAVVVLNNRQTSDEQTSETTRHNNGRGFQPAHAKMGTSHAIFYALRGFLTPKQIAYWRKLNAKGQMRIARYWRQLQEEAMAKTRAVTTTLTTYPGV